MGERPAIRAAATVLVATLVLGACGTARPEGPEPGTVSAEVVAGVARVSGPVPAHPVPTAPIPDVAGLAGRTVWYVPFTDRAPQFRVTAQALRRALDRVRLGLRTCDGAANPATIAACLDGARAARAGAVVTDAVPYAVAGPALDATRAAGTPVLITDQAPNIARPADATLGYLEGAGDAQLVAAAEWIIQDSGARGSVLINVSADSSSTGMSVDAAEAEFARECPACRVRLNRVSSARPDAIATSTRDALLAAPDVGYVLSQFDQYLGPTRDGVVAAGRVSTVKGVSTAAQRDGLQMLADGDFLAADVGQSSAFQGWLAADGAMRLMRGLPVPPTRLPIRLVDRATVGRISLTPQAEASGEWYGPTDFPAAFARTWGV